MAKYTDVSLVQMLRSEKEVSYVIRSYGRCDRSERGVVIDKAIIAEDTVIGDGAILGVGEESTEQARKRVFMHSVL